MSIYTQIQREAERKQRIKEGKEEEEVTMENILDGPVKRPASSKRYKTSEEKYADARSTATTFFLVGGLGLLAIVLTFAGVLHLPVPHFTLYSMSVFFIVFLVIGAVYFKNSKKILEKAGAEHARIKKITDWYQTEGVSSKELLELLEAGPKDEPEVFYLQKYELVQKLLKNQFPDEEEALLDKLASDFSEEERIDAMMVEEVRLEAAMREKRNGLL